MQTPNPQRPEPRRQTAAYAGAPVTIPSHNERQLLARIAQLERLAQGIRLCPGFDVPHYDPSSAATRLFAYGHTGKSFFGRMHDSTYGITWFGQEALLDQLGRAWARDYNAVIDDFGNLVEVAR